MAETKLINFRYGTYGEINGLGKDANCIYIASDKPLFYAVGKWHGIASMTSEVDRVNSKTILKINGDGGYAINCEIEGETLSKDLKEKLINAYEFVQLISGEDEDVIINKWNDIVAFLQGFGEADKLLNVVVELQNGLADEVANRISADQKHTEDIKSITDLVNDMFTLVDKGDGTKYIQSKYGFASDSFISARGVDNESSGVGGLDAQAVWDLLMQNDDATKIINVAHIPDITIAKITDIANASVASATNADLLDGLHAKDFVKYFVGTSVAEVQSSSLGYGQTEFGSKVNGLLLTGLYLDGKYGGQINGNTAGTELYYRGKTGSGWTTWKQLAFTDSNVASATNADKLDGLHASDFLKLEPVTTYLDLNTLHENRLYPYFQRIGTSDDTSSNVGTARKGVLILTGGTSTSNLLFDHYSGSIYYRNLREQNMAWSSWKELAFKATTLSGYGITDAVTLNTAQTISGVKTFSNLKVNNSTMIANLNAEMVGGYNATSLLTLDVNAVYDTCKLNSFGVLSGIGSYIRFGSSANFNTILYAELGKLKATITHSGNEYATKKEIAFTDTNSLTPSGGTLNVNGVVKISNTLYTNNILPSNGYSDCIGNENTAFNIYTPNIVLNNLPVRIQNNNLGRWFRILDLSKCSNSSALVSIYKGYNNNPSGGIIFAVNANSHAESNCMITVLSGNLGVIKKIRVVSDWEKSYVDVYISNIKYDSSEVYYINKIGSGTIIDFESLEEAGGTVRTELDITLGFSCSRALYGAGLNINGTASITGDTTINGSLKVSNQLTIGNATLYWDVANQCLRINSGIASDSFLSAKGIDTTGNGQGGGGGFDAQMMWQELTMTSPTNTGKTIMLDLLPDIPTSKVTDFANQVKALITVDNIPTLTSAKISDFNSAVATAMASTLSDISANLSNHEQRLQAIEQALTWQGVS